MTLNMTTYRFKNIRDPWEQYNKIFDTYSNDITFASFSDRNDCSCCGYEKYNYELSYSIDDIDFDYDKDEFKDVKIGFRLTIRILLIASDDDGNDVKSNDIMDVIEFDSISHFIEYFQAHNAKLLFNKFIRDNSFKQFWDNLNFLTTVLL